MTDERAITVPVERLQFCIDAIAKLSPHRARFELEKLISTPAASSDERDAAREVEAKPASDAGNWYLMQRDEALIALRDAIDSIKYGLPTDDKLILENLQAAGVTLFRQDGCVNHPDRPVRDVLDGKRLCQTCCENWAAGERP